MQILKIVSNLNNRCAKIEPLIETTVKKWLVCLFVLMFYDPVNPMGSCQGRSVYQTTLSLERFSPINS